MDQPCNKFLFLSAEVEAALIINADPESLEPILAGALFWRPVYALMSETCWTY